MDCDPSLVLYFPPFIQPKAFLAVREHLKRFLTNLTSSLDSTGFLDTHGPRDVGPYPPLTPDRLWMLKFSPCRSWYHYSIICPLLQIGL